MLHNDLTDKIICSFYNVYNRLGFGFLEKVYENSMVIELQRHSLHIAQQEYVTVYYEDQPVGVYLADIVVNRLVIVELKAAEALRNEHYAQPRNYLKATDKEVGLLLNFGQKPEFKRIVLANATKPHQQPHQ
jgi:GxxExxY protein